MFDICCVSALRETGAITLSAMSFASVGYHTNSGHTSISFHRHRVEPICVSTPGGYGIRIAFPFNAKCITPFLAVYFDSSFLYTRYRICYSKNPSIFSKMVLSDFLCWYLCCFFLVCFILISLQQKNIRIV